jgi:hypothetical protein
MSGTLEYARWQQIAKTDGCQWKTFQDFFDDLGPISGDRQYLVRNDVTRPHSKKNSRWGTWEEQQDFRTIKSGNKTLGLRDWAKELGITSQAMYLRADKAIALGLRLEETVLTGSRATIRAGAAELPPGIDEGLIDGQVHAIELNSKRTPVSDWTFRRLLHETATARSLKFKYVSLGNYALVQFAGAKRKRRK